MQIINKTAQGVKVGAEIVPANTSCFIHSSFVNVSELRADYKIERKGALVVIISDKSPVDAGYLDNDDIIEAVQLPEGGLAPAITGDDGLTIAKDLAEGVYVYPSSIFKKDGTIGKSPAQVKLKKDIDEEFGKSILTREEFALSYPALDPSDHVAILAVES